jgi:urease accessory protein
MHVHHIVRRPAVKSAFVLDDLILTYAQRQLQGGQYTTAKGRVIDVHLEKPVLLQEGDALKADDGNLIQIKAAIEPLLKVESSNPLRLLKAALHLGDHHIATQISDEGLLIPVDAYAQETVRALGCSVTPVERPFSPEVMHDHSACHDHEHEHTHNHNDCCGHHH